MKNEQMTIIKQTTPATTPEPAKTTAQVEHNPLPWTHVQPSYYAGDARQIQCEGKIVIASYIKPQDAVLIIRAVNNHEKLVAICKELLSNLQGKSESDPGLLEDRLIKIINDVEML